MLRVLLLAPMIAVAPLPVLAAGAPLSVEFVRVEETPLEFDVKLTGTISAKDSIELSFPQGGRIAGIEVQAGGGLRVEDVAPLAAAGVRAFHLSASRAITGGAAGPGGGASERRVVDPDLVSQYVAAARAAVGAS